MKMLLCDGEFVSKGEAKEEASVYKYQSGDCILQEVMACYCIAPPRSRDWHLWEKAALIMGSLFTHRTLRKNIFCIDTGPYAWKEPGQFLFISLEEYSGFSKLVCGGYEQDLSDVFYLYQAGEILTGLN